MAERNEIYTIEIDVSGHIAMKIPSEILADKMIREMLREAISAGKVRYAASTPSIEEMEEMEEKLKEEEDD